MYLLVGNNDAIEGYRDATSDDPDLVRFRPVDGERITELRFPEGTGLQEAFTTALAALESHMAQGASPTWIESDSEGLTALLQEHWGLTQAKTSRPKTWGRDTGADAFALPADSTPKEG